MARVLAALLALASPAVVSAQNLGTGFSGPVTGDGAASYYNPAAMALGDSRIDLDLGASFIRVTFDPDDVAPVTTSGARPYLTLGAFTDALHPDLRLGIAVGLPAANGGDWDLSAEASSITRYYLNSGTNLHFGATPALSYSPTSWISIGAGAHLVYARTDGMLDKDFGSQLNIAAMSDSPSSPFPYADPAFAAPIEVKGSGFGVGGIFGVVVRPTPRVVFGASVHTPVNIDAVGTIAVTYPESLRRAVDDILPSAELPDLNGTFSAPLNLPWMVHVGLSVEPVPDLELSLYYRWENVSSQPFWNVHIIEATSDFIGDTAKAQGYDDRHFVQLRVGYDVAPALHLSVIGSYATSTVPDSTTSPNNLDFHRIEVGLAARWRISRRVGLVAQYSHLFLPTRTITQSLHRPLADPALGTFNHPSPTGTYGGASDTIRFSVQFFFDGDDDAQEEDDAPAEDLPAESEGSAEEEGADEEGGESTGAWWEG